MRCLCSNDGFRMTVRRNKVESQSYSPWQSISPPERILVIRHHGVGDVAITLPSCTALRNHLPHARIDFLTSASNSQLPEALQTFDSVLKLEIPPHRRGRVMAAILCGLKLQRERYDLIIDLQRNWMSRTIRRLCHPQAWAEFDRFAPKPAGERVLDVFRHAGFPKLEPQYRIEIESEILERAKLLLVESGWNGIDPLVVLNPAGLWTTRNWPLEKYIELARLWLAQEQVRFLLLGDSRLIEKAHFMRSQLGSDVISLVGKTGLGEAFAILQFVQVVVSEDSGLMHMAWVSGVPTVALFGSSRHDWSRPLGSHSALFHSGDLECGACMEPTCRFGDVHCLQRIRTSQVFEQANHLLLEKASSEQILSHASNEEILPR